ncbi:hypothetical protein ACGFZS_06195 [Streptomyces sp. NPDC048288]|uniref:hypothetical protein n=1 Tax=Streptomyces sp. NPDC048288 TaxID=3365529 RepID=UPI003711B063
MTRQEVQAARVWFARAKEAQLADAAVCSVAGAARMLRHEYDFPDHVVADPSAGQLVTLLEVLDPEFARCVVHGLLHPRAAQLPVADMVEEHPEKYFHAADREPPPHAHDIGPSLNTPTTAEPHEKPEAATMTSRESQANATAETAPAQRSVAAELRHRAEELARALRETADRLAEGRSVVELGWTRDDITHWQRRRSLLTESVTAAGGSWAADAGFGELEAELDLLEVRAAAERERRLDGLRRNAEQLKQMIAEAEDTVAAHLEQALERLTGQISELSRPADGTPEPGHGEAAEPGPRVTGAAEVEAAETNEPADAGDLAMSSGAAAADTHERPPAQAEPDTSDLPGEPDPAAAETAPIAAEPTAATVVPAESEVVPAVSAVVPAVSAVVPAPAPTSAVLVPESGMDAERVDDATDVETVEPPDDAPWPAGMEHADWDPSEPWETGQHSPVAQLIAEGLLPQAYWMTAAASREPGTRVQALAFAAAAFSCVGSDEATQAQIDHDIAPESLADDREALLVATVAALRAGLSAGWPHVLVSDFALPSGLPSPWQQLLTVLVSAVRDCKTFVPGAIEDLADPGDTLTLRGLGEDARVLLEDLPRRKIKYQRASRVLQYLAGPSGALHQALKAVVDWAHGGDPAQVARLSESFKRPDHTDRLIEEADSRFRTPKQAKESIHSGALRQLHAAVRSVSEVLAKADAVAGAIRSRGATKGGELPALGAVVSELEAYEAPSGVGGAALGLLRDWVVGHHVADTSALTSTEQRPFAAPPSADFLLLSPGLPRDTDGQPDLNNPGTSRAMAAFLAPVSPDDALAAYLGTGDLHLARALITWTERNPVHAVGLPEDWADTATRRIREAEKDWRNRTTERHRQAAGLLAQIRTLNLMAPDEERDFTGRLEEFADGDEAGRYRHALTRLAQLVQELRVTVENSTDRLRQDLDNLRLDPERPLAQSDHDRIWDLIEEGDTVTAQEFLALAGGGNQLPERPEDDGSELVEFVAGLTGSGVPQPGGEGVHASWWVRRYGSDARLTSAAEQALDSWQALCSKKGRSSEWQQHIPRVLRLLGLEPATGSLNSDRPGQGIRRLKLRASVAEAAGYVAALGSRATSYTILLVWEEQRDGGALSHLEDADVDANIVLYLHPLGLGGRKALAEAASGHAQQALVVDPAVFGWMAARAPRSFRALQRVTLPWTSYNPYTPFVAGLVPPEVFYGRDEELREVMDPNGGLFLYGGRQLGKSALLQRVAELFPSRSESNVAVYLDLLKAEIGQAEPPEQIWSLLAEGLKRRQVFNAKLSDRATPDTVARRIRDWLDEDESRRLLILADEADAFLTADSRRVFRSGGESTFQNVKRFQQLMEQTNRRLKIVFAGLHQVQRFGDLSNVSTAHGGPDVLVGPLKPHAAVRLVTEPMAALGFVFDRPELVWRILAITNYQANLVQIFCSELVRTLQGRPRPEAEHPTRIKEEDVQGVAASETVRRRLAERLRFTINLEDRYRVLTLVIALRSLADRYRGDYTPEQLLDLARDAWSDGFDELGVKRVEIYLTEMVGLGLLVQLGDRRFAVRSPNVVNMLGTREELELELRESEFSLPYDYDPRAARRLLGRDNGNGIQRYSPLTEGQLHEAAQPGVTLIGTTSLYQPPLMIRAAEAFAEARGVEVHKVKVPYDLRTVLAEAARMRRNYVLVADLRGLDPVDLAAAVQQCVDHAGPAADERVRSTARKHTGNRSVFLLADAVVAGALRDTRGDAPLPVRHLRPERWTVDSLRAWPECPFVSRGERGRLIAVTGGWAPFVEQAIAEVSVRGATLESSLDAVSRAIAKPENLAEHWNRSGLDAGDEELLGLWSSYVDEGQGVPLDDVAAAIERDLEETRRWLDRLDLIGVLDALPTGLAVDPVTFRAARARVSGA